MSIEITSLNWNYFFLLSYTIIKNNTNLKDSALKHYKTIYIYFFVQTFLCYFIFIFCSYIYVIFLKFRLIIKLQMKDI